MNEKNKKLWQLVAILAVNLALLALVSFRSAEAMRLGSSGERIAEIQRELHRRNLFSGSINGFFDLETRRSISDFQSLSGIEKNGEADFKTLSALGLDSHYSDCFSAPTELLARCIQLSGCRSYPEMLKKGTEILDKTDSAFTLGKYISENHSDFSEFTDEPSADAYNAAVQAIRKAALK